MATRSLELTLISAKDLKNVNLFSHMEVYAVVSISGDPRTRQRTPPDRNGGRNPNWNYSLYLTIPADDQARAHVLHVLLRTHRLFGSRDIGEVRVPLHDLLVSGSSTSSSSQPAAGPKFLSYQVRRPSSGKAKGVLNFSYKLGEIYAAPDPIAAYPALANAKSPSDAPVTAYPIGSSYPNGYPPPAAAYPQYGGAPPQHYPPPGAYYPYGAPPPPQAGYGYPPAGYGYAAPPPAQQKAKKNKFGMGLGAGLLGGALGGLLIGDMVSDAAAYDDGYSAGFDDAGDF